MMYEELVKALRICSSELNCGDCPLLYRDSCSSDELMADAADAIEALQADVRFWEAAVKGQDDGIKVLQAKVKRLKEANDELREAQTYIDHYGDRWMTSAKDVPTSAYEHGYADGRDEAEAQLPKRGEWVWKHRHHGGFKTAKGKCECGRDVYAQIDERYETDDPYCPFCGVMNDSIHLNYCPNCGSDMRAKMEGCE